MVLAHNMNIEPRTQDVQIKEDITFESILLAKNTLSGLKKAGFYKPSPIQLHGIPLGKCGFDLLLEAKSGTGKTAVFTVTALEKLDLQKGLQVIMLAPTREIAAQICDVIREIGSDYFGLNVEVVMGGLPVQEDISKFKAKLVHIVVGSPGRLKHLILDKHIDVSAVRLVVLDECDKLVEKSFLSDINTIFSILPKQKQVIMSSATYPENCKTFISKYVHNAQHICPDSSSVLLGITQKVTIVKFNNNIVKQTHNRFEELLKIIGTRQFKQCLIFCNYQARVTELHKMLLREKWPAELLYGQQEQHDRLGALRTLQEYKCRILISTDLAARGIDASNVDLIINFEPPFEWQTYLHRIGRAGRYGSFGTAITILSEGKEVTKFKELFEPINLSLDLRNLWTGDEFSDNIQMSSSDTLVVQKTDLTMQEEIMTPDHVSKLIWDNLTCEYEKDTEGFQTFEELQKSCQTICSSNINNIENFTDLLTSFKQSHDTSNEYIEYKCVNVTQIPIKNYLKCFQNENAFNEEIETSYTTHFNPNTINPVLSALSVKSKEEQNQKTNAISLQLHTDMDAISHYKHPCNVQKPITCGKGNNSIDNISNKALQEAGLPASFGKNKNYHGSKYSSLDNRLIRKVNNKKEMLREHSDTPGVKPISSSKLEPQHKRNSDSIIRPKNYTEFSSTSWKKSPLYNNLREMHSYTYLHANQNKFGSKYDYKFKIWYNQIKGHIKYMEYVIYINEMSKL